ncbi:hypothetical protein ACUXIW_003776 [Ralstonia pickettii]
MPDQKATNATEAQRLGGNSRRQKKKGKSGSQCTSHDGLIIGDGLVATFDYGMRAGTAQGLVDRDAAHRLGEYLLGAVPALSAARTHAERFGEFIHRRHAQTGGAMDFTVGDLVADTDVHGLPPQRSKRAVNPE